MDQDDADAAAWRRAHHAIAKELALELESIERLHAIGAHTHARARLRGALGRLRTHIDRLENQDR